MNAIVAKVISTTDDFSERFMGNLVKARQRNATTQSITIAAGVNIALLPLRLAIINKHAKSTTSPRSNEEPRLLLAVLTVRHS